LVNSYPAVPTQALSGETTIIHTWF